MDWLLAQRHVPRTEFTDIHNELGDLLVWARRTVILLFILITIFVALRTMLKSKSTPQVLGVIFIGAFAIAITANIETITRLGQEEAGIEGPPKPISQQVDYDKSFNSLDRFSCRRTPDLYGCANYGGGS